jgi:hypothetical protein
MEPGITGFIRYLFLSILLEISVNFLSAEYYADEGIAYPYFIYSDRYIKNFIMKYLISLEEFVLYDKRNYHKFFYHPDTRSYNGRGKPGRLFC